jgi:hypothetical protein
MYKWSYVKEFIINRLRDSGFTVQKGACVISQKILVLAEPESI